MKTPGTRSTAKKTGEGGGEAGTTTTKPAQPPPASVSPTASFNDLMDISKDTNSQIKLLAQEVQELQTRVLQLQQLLDQQQAIVAEQNQTISQQNKTLASLANKVERLEEENNERERHSRSWNLVWVNSKKEERNEDCEKMVLDYIEQIPELKERHIMIDVAHRIGRWSDRPRSIIFRLVRKRDAWTILKYKNQLRMTNNGLVFQDLTHKDREAKNLHAQAIRKLVMDTGKKCRFTAGKWYVGNQPYDPNQNYA